MNNIYVYTYIPVYTHKLDYAVGAMFVNTLLIVVKGNVLNHILLRPSVKIFMFAVTRLAHSIHCDSVLFYGYIKTDFFLGIKILI